MDELKKSSSKVSFNAFGVDDLEENFNNSESTESQNLGQGEQAEVGFAVPGNDLSEHMIEPKKKSSSKVSFNAFGVDDLEENFNNSESTESQNLGQGEQAEVGFAVPGDDLSEHMIEPKKKICSNISFSTIGEDMSDNHSVQDKVSGDIDTAAN